MWLRLPHGPVTVRTGPCSAQDGAPTLETAPGPSWGQPGPAGTWLPAPTGVAQPRVTATVAWCHARGAVLPFAQGPQMCHTHLQGPGVSTVWRQEGRRPRPLGGPSGSLAGYPGPSVGRHFISRAAPCLGTGQAAFCLGL